MLHNTNTSHPQSVLTALLKTKVQRGRPQTISAERHVGIFQALPEVVTAREFRETVSALERRFAPVPIDDAMLVLRLAALTLEVRYSLPEAAIGPGPRDPVAERLRHVYSSQNKHRMDLSRATETFEELDTVLETLEAGRAMSEFPWSCDPFVRILLRETAKEFLTNKEKEEALLERIEPASETAGIPPETGPGKSPDESETSSSKAATDTPDAREIAVLTQGEGITIVRDAKELALAQVKRIRKKLSEELFEEIHLTLMENAKKTLTPEQTSRINEHARAVVAEMRDIEDTLNRRRRERRENSSGSTGVEAT